MSSSPNPPMPPSRSSSKGPGGVIVAILALVAVGLGILAIALNSKRMDLAALVEKAEAAKKTAEDSATAARGETQRVVDERNSRYMLVSQLPQDLQGSGRPVEALAKIQQMYQAVKVASIDPNATPAKPGEAVKPAGPSDAASAALEAVARSVLKSNFDTKAAVDNDPVKTQLHRQVQTVLARIGAFNKPVSGNQKDTMDAVLAFQKTAGLKADGVIGKGTWGKVREKYDAMPKTASASAN